MARPQRTAPPPHVLHVYKDYPPVLGGIEKHIRTLARHQVRAGWRVTVLVTNPDPFPRGLRTRVEDEEGIRVIRSGRYVTLASTPISLAQAWHLLRASADIVHLHFPYPPGEIVNWLRARGPTVITYHSDVVRQKRILRLYAPLLRRILREAQAIIATSIPYLRTSPFLREVADRVHVIPLGIDLTPFLHVSEEAARQVRREIRGTDEEVPVVLFVGRLRYYKGVDVLLRALARVPRVEGWIVGTGPMREAWERLSVRLGLGNRVRFLGDVPEARLPLIYAASDMFVLPATSRAEAFGLVLVEAMASGRPVISTEVGTGTSYVNVHGHTGLVVPPGDPEALAQAVRQLANNPQLRRRMGAAARERAQQGFTAEFMTQRVLALYTSLMKTP